MGCQQITFAMGSSRATGIIKQKVYLLHTFQYIMIIQELSTNNYIEEKQEDLLKKSATFVKLSHMRSGVGKSKLRQTNLSNLKSKIKLKCVLCYQFLPGDKFTSFTTCKHKNFCEDCASQFIQAQILDRVVEIQCEFAGCSGTLDVNSAIFEKLDDKFKQIRESCYRFSMKSIKCRKPDCPGYLNPNHVCQVCQTQHCTRCFQFKHDLECQMNQLIQNESIKKCPNCQIPIYKDEGCNHMVCQCKHQFCFVCLQKWNKTHHFCRPNEAPLTQYSCQCIWISITVILLIVLIILLAIFLTKN